MKNAKFFRFSFPEYGEKEELLGNRNEQYRVFCKSLCIMSAAPSPAKRQTLLAARASSTANAPNVAPAAVAKQQQEQPQRNQQHSSPASLIRAAARIWLDEYAAEQEQRVSARGGGGGGGTRAGAAFLSTKPFTIASLEQHLKQQQTPQNSQRRQQILQQQQPFDFHDPMDAGVQSNSKVLLEPILSTRDAAAESAVELGYDAHETQVHRLGKSPLATGWFSKLPSGRKRIKSPRRATTKKKREQQQQQQQQQQEQKKEQEVSTAAGAAEMQKQPEKDADDEL